MSPRVLHVTHAFEYGLARVLEHLVADQTARGWDARLASWQATRDPGRALPAELRRLAEVVAEADPDVVHLHSSKAGLAGRLVLRGRRPTIFQPHAWSFHAVGGPVRAAALAWERWAVRWTDVVVCCSTAEYREGERHRIRGRFVVVPNPVDVDRFVGVDRAAARRALHLDADAPVVVCVGRLSHQKGQDVVLHAWPTVTAALPGARLVLVGDGPDEAALAAKASGLDGVSLVGCQPRVEDWLAAADVVVQPSRYEGQALTVLEAMAAGRSVVATDVEGMAEAIGPGGAIVRPGDVQALAQAVVHRLRDADLAASEGRAGRERAARSHDLRAWGERMAELTLGVLP